MGNVDDWLTHINDDLASTSDESNDFDNFGILLNSYECVINFIHLNITRIIQAIV